jgi:hypothetical protein
MSLRSNIKNNEVNRNKRILVHHSSNFEPFFHFYIQFLNFDKLLSYLVLSPVKNKSVNTVIIINIFEYLRKVLTYSVLLYQN